MADPNWDELFRSGDPIDDLLKSTAIETVTDFPPSQEVSEHALDEVEQAFREVFGDEQVERLEDF